MPSHITQAEGLGLNPVLQDIGLVIHPPILYFGYLCYAIPFAITVRWLNYPNNDIDLNLLKTSSKFIRVGLASMTCGIGLGAWWAYRELGWGGYWFFDPVENISLMPWLVGISLHHCMNVTLKNKKLFNWTNTLSLICFPIVVLGAFLVRSGAITSVHSFTSSTGRSIYLLCIFSLISLLSLYSLLRHSRYEIVNLMIKPYSQKFRSLSTPEKGIMIGSCFWICALVVLCCSSIYPIVVMNIKNQIISINYEFFVKFFVPLCLFAGIITASSHSRTTTQRLLQHICLALLLTCVANLKMRTTIIASLAIFSGAFLTISTLHILATSSKYFIELPDRKRVSMILGHLGFGMLILCCCINTVLQKEVDFIGRAGDKVTKENLEITLNNLRFSSGANYYKQIADFSVYDRIDGNVTLLRPENRFYLIEKRISQESDIFSYLTHDIYAVLNRVDDDIIHAKIYYRPLISFIWLSVLLMFCGLLLPLI
jgi:cytochrome c-type biogenesis protein CcmF